MDRFLVPSESESRANPQNSQIHDQIMEMEIIEKSSMIQMGFPTRQIKYPQICACHGQPKNMFYTCPNCQTPSCELSTQCRVCGILLLSSTKLSRTSQQHGPLFEIQPFVPIGKFLLAEEGKKGPNLERLSLLCSRNIEQSSVLFLCFGNKNNLACFACDKAQRIDIKSLDQSESVVCPSCIGLFCIDCDIFIHQTLLCCPGCTTSQNIDITFNQQ